MDCEKEYAALQEFRKLLVEIANIYLNYYKLLENVDNINLSIIVGNFLAIKHTWYGDSGGPIIVACQ